MSKKWSLIIVLTLAFLTVGMMSHADAEASNEVKLMVEGQYVESDVPAQIIQGRTFVPIRFIVENIGAQVSWNQAESRIDIFEGSTHLRMYLGEETIHVNGQAQEMDTAPFLENYRTMVPLRFVSEYLGLRVGWDNAEKQAFISTKVNLVVNHTTFEDDHAPVNISGDLYVPIFDMARELNVAFWLEDDVYKFTYTQTSDDSDTEEDLGTEEGDGTEASDKQGSKEESEEEVTMDLPPSEIVNVDGVKMVNLSWVDQLLGTKTEYDRGLQLVTVDRDIDYLTLREVSLENGRYMIHVPGLDAEETEHFFLRSPHRFVLDIPQTELDQDQEWDTALSHDTVDDVRVGQFSTSPMTARVVFDLNKRSKVDFEIEGDKIYLAFTERKPIVVIDAGHGGHDPGANGSFSSEKDIVLAISNQIVDYLEQDADIEVEATRPTDEYVTLGDRAAYANEINADMFISVHANAAGSSAIGGTETYIYYGSNKAFGDIVHKHLIKATQLNDRGLKEAGFKVLRETRMPAALLEIAFLSNPDEEKLLNDPAFQDKVAKAMYDAIREYEFGSDE
ncbi:N-acetylmuramoyl-L-alanine amidase family protein [Caldalkalibacillus salinus]|uniref:N-acetylmuramoyl-L-alanine amidase family protein n=1 Tax=Caldalkalibacillus salinus TaxID=2803787 RepID=UPI001922EFBE|nr:N-acetylmuramoyl-L-alanine amidase family protein [Caldalkalibacillus salinus]